MNFASSQKVLKMCYTQVRFLKFLGFRENTHGRTMR